MKKIILFSMLMYSIFTYAFQTVLTTSIYASEDAGTNTVHNVTNIPTTTKRVRFINRITTNPEIEIALTTAEYIFSAAMESENIDLVPIEAEVMFGDRLEFEELEVCKVLVLYTNSIPYHIYYHYINQYEYNDIPTLIPMTMYNQCIGSSNGLSMQIRLNPNISYHYNTTSVPLEKYDAITVLLRALAIGCGIQSTIDPESVQFGIIKDGITYINAFDSHIYNDQQQTYSDVVLGYLNAETFLNGRKIYAKGFEHPHRLHPVELFNDWETSSYGYNLTRRTLNTISPWNYTEEELNSNFYDILDVDLSHGIEQRTISTYTMALLRGLGWEKTVPVGNDILAEVTNSTLHCTSTILLPNQTYSVWLSRDLPLTNLVCKLYGPDSSYVIGSCNNQSFSYQSIPNNIQWKRNPITKHIIGHFQCKTGIVTENGFIEQEKNCLIEIPYKPNRPIVHRSESTANGVLNLNLKAFANGSNTYTVTYTGVTYGDSYSFTCTANDLDTIINNIPANQLYNLSIYGTNNEGNSDSYNFTFGSSARPILNLTVAVRGTTLTYNFNGIVDASEVVISSVRITNTQGIIVMTSDASIGEPIDISSLTRGNYTLTVVADGIEFSRLFIRR